MTRALPFAAIALAALLAVMGAANETALASCQAIHSLDTCAYALR